MSKRIKGKRAAAAWYQKFHDITPTRSRNIRIREPAVVATLGTLDAISYTAVVDYDGAHKAVPFKHTFKRGSKPVLCTDGKCLYIIEGRFHVTARGIVDLSPKGRERE